MPASSPSDLHFQQCPAYIHARTSWRGNTCSYGDGGHFAGKEGTRSVTYIEDNKYIRVYVFGTRLLYLEASSLDIFCLDRIK